MGKEICETVGCGRPRGHLGKCGGLGIGPCTAYDQVMGSGKRPGFLEIYAMHEELLR